jgi:hypothetical protein
LALELSGWFCACDEGNAMMVMGRDFEPIPPAV